MGMSGIVVVDVGKRSCGEGGASVGVLHVVWIFAAVVGAFGGGAEEDV